MKNFITQGSNWTLEVEIDNDAFEKHLDMACEAATQAVEIYLDRDFTQIKSNNEEAPSLGPFMMAYEEGDEGDEDKVVIFLTEHILRNAGKHDLADQINEEMIKRTRKP